MALECSREAILNFLRERHGRVANTELVEHFKPVFPSDPTQRAATRELFKRHVDSVAYVNTDAGVKYVCLKKKFCGEALKLEKSQREDGGQVSGRDVGPGGLATGAQTGSGFTHAGVPHVLETLQRGEQLTQSECNGGAVKEDAMGNRGSVKREKRQSKREENVGEIPVITVSQPSPVPVQEPVFVLSKLDQNVNTERDLTQTRQVPTPEELREETRYPGVFSDEDDAQSLTGSEGTPKNSRKHFIEVMMCTSPQVRRNIDMRAFSHSDSDCASVASCVLDEDRNSVALDPLEHEWMMCASDAEWGSLQRLLNNDPGLVLKKDFITGFTCLHWAAKQGKPELIALIINFAKQNNIAVSVDVRSSTGYTPLHLAAMHNHMEVVKLLVGAYNADVEIRDYSGRKACQYLTDNVSVDIRDIIGVYEIETENKPSSAGKRWSFSKVLHAKPLRRLNSAGDSDSPDGGAAEKPMRRRSSFTRMKPKLQKLKWRTSQLMHSTTFHGAEDLEKRKRSRPKTHFFEL